MARRLANTVGPLSEDPDGGQPPLFFGPGDDLPAWAEARLVEARGADSKIWATDEADTAEAEPAVAPAPPAPNPTPPAPTLAAPPPRGGEGSGRDVWAAYAESLGIDVDETASRDDIVEAVDARGGG